MGEVRPDIGPMSLEEIPEPPVEIDRHATVRQRLAIEVGKYDVFKEEQSEYIDEMEYSRKGSDPGLVVIFNHETFDGGKYDDRDGTRRDVEELIITLGRLKFNIEAEFIYNDLTIEETENEIQRICNMDLTERNCLICVFLSHGSSDNQLVVRDGVLDAEKIYTPFTECQQLKGKPKLFIFQACKNEKLENNTVDENDDITSELVCERTLNMKIPEDLLLLYSTLEGEVSFRNELYGSWFIQELCRNFNGYGRRDDLFSLIIRTTKCVATNYIYETIIQDKSKNEVAFLRIKQMPIFISTLRKKFYLTKSKDRIVQLQMKEEIKKLNKRVNELYDKLKELDK